MKTSEKIKTLRQEKGLSQEALGDLVGVKKAAINKYETGRVVNIKKSTLQKLADALGVLPADLLDDPDTKRAYPIYEAAAGEGRINDGYPSETADLRLEADQSYFRIKGRSMEPTLQDGDLVVISAQSVLDYPRQLALVKVNGEEATIKRVEKKESGLVLLADNVDVFSPHYYTRDEVENLPVRIEGVVTKLIRDM